MKVFFLGTGLILTVLLSSQSYAAELLALDEAVAVPLKNHPQVIEARENDVA